ncbi:MAG: hypothetical protein COV34_01760 [Candidatus Zambryskibacteria bacterium CG10_big_fil_rev_8_21_14_0_10_42_12]|uniref:Uncharacterized protein n=1 Tax=Candidatus Zambryskibacteria bacterium CG10_big_fil_rev_8_21_14_0_10_42_12 TaxID=1975115 RepID=A0A2H0QVL2_9BACT|nr:MAG: hypothetical protein COV34_01760 [Candidatus Zambryskibacteria bacterium CG10_big_fil_rev_8_21_14_0_10_42_12]
MDPNIKLNRARKRLDELQIWIDKYFSVTPYKVSVRTNSENRSEYYLCDVVPVPVDITLLACEVIQNLRSSLDHLVYKAFKTDPANNKKDGSRICFPINDSKEGYDLEKNKKIVGVPQAIRDKIDVYKPYKEGNIILWQLHKLNNIDKHRLPVTVGSRNGGVDIMPSILQTMGAITNLKKFDELQKNTGPLYLVPSDNSPVKKGDILFVDLPGKSPIQMDFQFFITFYEPGIIMGSEIKITLESMYSEVSKIVREVNELFVV